MRPSASASFLARSTSFWSSAWGRAEQEQGRQGTKEGRVMSYKAETGPVQLQLQPWSTMLLLLLPLLRARRAAVDASD